MTGSYWRTPRLSRRSLIAAGGVALSAAACGKTTKPATTSSSSGTSGAAGQPKKGGTLRYVQLSVGPMDPAMAPAAVLYYCVYEWMAVWKQTDGKVTPHLAMSWEQPDSSTIIFHMDPRAQWPNKDPLNGRKLTSHDVQYSYSYFTTPKPAYGQGTDLAPLDLSRSQTPDDTTLTLKLKQPFAPALSNLLTTAHVCIVPHEIVERDGDLTKTALGSGPFLVDSYTPNGAVTMSRNPSYWKPGLPYLDAVQTLYLTDVAAQFNAFNTGNVEMLQKLTFDQAKNLPKTANVLNTPLWNFGGIRFNTTHKPFDDVRVRRAFHLAIDRDAVNQIVYAGHSEPMAAIAPLYGKFALPKTELAQQPGYRTPKDQDLADAKKLLDAAGATNLSVTVVGSNNTPFNALMPVAIVDQLAKIGVKLTPDIQDGATYNRTRIGDYALLSDFSSGSGDPDSLIRSSFYTGSGANTGHYTNPQVDALIDKEALEPDPDKRAQIFYDIQRQLLTDMPYANMTYDVTITALQPDVQGEADWAGPIQQTLYHGFGQAAWLNKQSG